MNYAKIKEYDIANGPGVRTTIFFSGCRFKCKGCFNKEAQSFSYGEKFTEEVMEKFLEITKNPIIVGVNILGGEPLQQDLNILLLFILKVKETGKSIWMWTGYRYEELTSKMLEVVKNVDVLVDGRFEQNNSSLVLKHKGSSNQRVIDIKQTIKNNKVSIWGEKW